jgi:hypothetical protein
MSTLLKIIAVLHSCGQNMVCVRVARSDLRLELVRGPEVFRGYLIN